MHYQPAKTTKLSTGSILERKRCFELLRKASSAQILWLAAPGGSGKSSLAASFLEAEKAGCIWLKIDAGDADPANFFYYLRLAALGYGVDAALLPEFSPALGQDIAEFSRGFFSALFSLENPPDYIVMDNIHEVPPDSCPIIAVQAGLNRLTENACFILIGRTQPPPAFSRLQVNGNLKLLKMEDIAFQAPEVKEYLKLRGVKNADSETVASITEKTGGWAAGVRLLAEKVKRHGAGIISEDSLQTNDFFDYFSEEVFSVFEPEVRELLLKTCVLKEMDPETLQELSGKTDSEASLDELVAGNLFVERTEGLSPAYRYHPLFRDYLLKHLESELGPKGLQDARAKAGALLLSKGKSEEAAELFIEAEAWEDLSHVILGNAPGLLVQGRIGTLSAWLAAFPQERLKADPWLLYWSGVCLIFFDFENGREKFRQALQIFEDRGDTFGTLLSCAGILDGYIFEWRLSPMDPWIEKLEGLLHESPAFPSLEVEIHVMRSLFFALTIRQPNHPRMEHYVTRVKELVLDVPAPLSKLELCMALSLNAYFMGKPTLMQYVHDIIEGFTQDPSHYPTSVRIWLDTIWGLVGSTTGSFDKALHHIHDGLEQADTYGMKMFEPRLSSYGVYVHLHQNDTKGAKPYLTRMVNILDGFSQTDRLHYYILSCWHNYLEGRFPEALHEIKLGLKLASDFNMQQYNLDLQVYNSMILLQLGELNSAGEALESMHEKVLAFGSNHTAFHYTTARTQLYLLMGDEEKAKEWMHTLALYGRKMEGILVPFRGAKDVLEMYIWALENDIETDFVRSEILRYKYSYYNPPQTLVNWPRPIMVSTLGSFSIVVHDKELNLPGKSAGKLLSFLKILVSQKDASIREDVMMDALWPDVEGDMQKTSFNTTLHRLRKLLGEKSSIIFRDGLLSLNKEMVWIDRDAFEGFVQIAEHAEADEVCFTACDKALGLYRGHFLGDDSASDWIMFEQERLKALHLRCVEKAAAAYRKQQGFDEACRVYEAGLLHHPLNEGIFRSLIGLHKEQGHHDKAEEAYKRYKRLFKAEYGKEPEFSLSEV
jgi:DNA-binding SARP family transcriptional activator